MGRGWLSRVVATQELTAGAIVLWARGAAAAAAPDAGSGARLLPLPPPSVAAALAARARQVMGIDAVGGAAAVEAVFLAGKRRSLSLAGPRGEMDQTELGVLGAPLVGAAQLEGLQRVEVWAL